MRLLDSQKHTVSQTNTQRIERKHLTGLTADPLPDDRHLCPARPLKIFDHPIALDIQRQLLRGSDVPDHVGKVGTLDGVAAEVTIGVDRVPAIDGERARHRRGVLLVRAIAALVRFKARNARIVQELHEVQIARECEHAMWLGPVGVRPLAILLQRRRNRTPRSHDLVRNLRPCRPKIGASH